MSKKEQLEKQLIETEKFDDLKFKASYYIAMASYGERSFLIRRYHEIAKDKFGIENPTLIKWSI